MSVTQALPVASAIVILVFALLVFRRYRRRGGTHLLVWGIGLTMFGVASFAEAYSALGWNPAVFRLWYLGGAVLNAAWLGQGTVYLLSGQRLPNLLVALLLGYATAAVIFIALATAVGLGRGVEALLIAFHGLVFTAVLYRRWVRLWNPARLVALLTILLIAGSLTAAYLVFTIPLNEARFSPAETLSYQYREQKAPNGEIVPGILPKGATVRRFTPFFNIYGLIALVGGALAAYFSDGILSLGSLVGFYTVFGIAARNGILMINHFQHLEQYEGEVFGPGLVLRGAKERLSPILMTTLAAGLALVPLVLAGRVPGHEVEYPMAIVILGGLVTSTLLNLFVVPSLYLRFGKGWRRAASIPQAA